ncbi:histidine kinase [Methylovorus sp. MM2]|uniref:sensor histidine kinase n=1 Tax=Methylovorus sp. MM2 TaxID=1848038 RepID=UPI0007DFCABF|nr:CHASE3 domain-containing protein [Methylovorus sp. MM2]OAM52729.1 histidine kinase [Methylovorus sp. MM2]
MKKILFWIDEIIKRLGGRIIATLTAAMALSIIAVMFTDGWIVSMGKQGDAISHIRDNIATIYQLRTNVHRAESAQRGYLLTGRELYIAPFNDAIDGARANIKKIQNERQSNLVLKKQSDLDWLDAISASLEAKAAEMKMTLSLTKAGSTEEAKRIVDLDQGLSEMSKFMQYTQVLLDKHNDALTILLNERKTSLLLIRIAVIGSAVMLLLLVIVVIRQLLIEMVTRDQLRQQLAQDCKIYEDQLHESTRQLKILALGNQGDVERERQKLARELHDELGSILTATKMDVNWVIRKCKDTAPEIVEKLRKTIGYLDQGIQFKRQVVQDLHPSMITTFGFWPALKSLIEDSAERNHWEMDVMLPEESVVLSETIDLIAYRVVQESLNNASKYAQATKVSVHMLIELNYLKIDIQDNGIGVDMQTIDATRHGLSGMRNRVKAIGGHLDITSAVGEGMTTRALLPLDNK